MIQLYQYPYETLLQVSTKWNKTDSIDGYTDVERFEADMLMLMKIQNGLGLAANQIGITKRFFAIGHDSFDTFQKPAIIWNPLITKQSEEKANQILGWSPKHSLVDYINEVVEKNNE